LKKLGIKGELHLEQIMTAEFPQKLAKTGKIDHILINRRVTEVIRIEGKIGHHPISLKKGISEHITNTFTHSFNKPIF
jgi:hypothetical protein